MFNLLTPKEIVLQIKLSEMVEKEFLLMEEDDARLSGGGEGVTVAGNGEVSEEVTKSTQISDTMMFC
jgi:hypothetical protein